MSALRWVYLITGMTAVALAIAGVFLPLLPTTPFALLALWCFSRSSPERHHRLLHSRLLGPYLRHWQDGQGIPKRAKWQAIIVLWLSLAVSWYLLSPSPLKWFLLIPGIGTSLYLLTRANRPASHTDHPDPVMPNTLLIAAAVIENSQGQMLLVRKKGSPYFMQAGGKLEQGETPVQALQRELNEELNIAYADSEQVQKLGYFESEAANEPGFIVQAHVYLLHLDLQAQALAELEEVRWAYPDELENLQLAPLLREHILPAYLSRTADKTV